MNNAKLKYIAFLLIKGVAALIMLQTLFYKFSASAESVYIFTAVGMEPWGRIGVGVGELAASILLFVPGFTWLGALFAIGLMAGAMFFHFTILGLEIMGDGGYLFFLACVVMSCCLFLLYIYRKDMLTFIQRVKN